MGIKVFAFDCGGVLLRESGTATYDRWGERLGMTTDALWHSIWANEAWSLAEIGELTEEAFWVRIGDELGYPGGGYGCRANALNMTGDRFGPDPFYDAFLKAGD